MENVKNAKPITTKAVDIPRPVCPILSLMPGAGLHRCELDNCAWYNPCDNDCIVWAFANETADAIDNLTEAVQHVDKTIDFLPTVL